MKKVAITGFLASMVVMTGSAMAQDDVYAKALTTKGYVDAGLLAVYQKASGAADAASANAENISDLQGTVGGHTTSINALNVALNGTEETNGLLTDVAGLKETVGTLEQAGYLTEDDIATKADQSDLDTLAGTVNILTATVDGKASQSALDTLQQQVDSMDGAAYEAVEKGGVSIDGDHKVKLDVQPEDGATYVFTANGWKELPIQERWNPQLLTGAE